MIPCPVLFSYIHCIIVKNVDVDVLSYNQSSFEIPHFSFACDGSERRLTDCLVEDRGGCFEAAGVHCGGTKSTTNSIA